MTDHEDTPDLDALRKVAEAANAEWVSLKPGGWGSSPADQQTIQFAADARQWLLDRAAALDGEEASDRG